MGNVHDPQGLAKQYEPLMDKLFNPTQAKNM